MKNYYFILLFLILSCIGCSKNEPPPRQTYRVLIGQDTVSLNGKNVSSNEMHNILREDIIKTGFPSTCYLIADPQITYGELLTKIEPLIEASFVDCQFSITEQKPIKATALTCPITFVQAKEEIVVVNGRDIETKSGLKSFEEYDNYLLNSIPENKNLRVTINATSETSAKNFYEALLISQKHTNGYIVWDIRKLNSNRVKVSD